MKVYAEMDDFPATIERREYVAPSMTFFISSTTIIARAWNSIARPESIVRMLFDFESL